MAMSDEARDRLIALGVRSERAFKWWQERWDEREDWFWDDLESEEQVKRAYERWLPELQEFARERRVVAAAPEPATLSDARQEQHRILREMMQRFAKSEDCECIIGRRYRVPILTVSRVGLNAAAEVFGESDAIILTPRETQEWFARVGNDETWDWWYACASWTVTWGFPAPEATCRVEALPEADRFIENLRDCPPAVGSEYWIASESVIWGPTAGGGSQHLWEWAGTQAVYRKLWSCYSY
ncbi:MAG TPA: hypothetical protein VGE52_11000 [Pirellulales bacterium]